MSVEQLVTYADYLAQELQDCGHEIFCIDILDALASSGLTLTSALNNSASTAYMTVIEALERNTAGDKK